ncbi:Spy0128 family protein [Bifidobacterium pullorum]|uniref:Spy0128 family protein n=1 Tax=Bifidobacterium pullorum TaxID=78448 RepID=UPI00242FB849|nr:FctA domain-containing protein [Bifidobacterium pullorum]
MIAAVTVMFVPAPAAQAAGTTVVDPNTTSTWESFTNPGGVTSTQNVGRIWTDKSVFNGNYTFAGSEDLSGQTVNKANDSDFLVSLSALSSTSNLKTTTTTTTPLDIVLVVDTSGSMDNGQGDSMGSVTTYEQIYGQNLSSNRTYYVLVDGEYVAVEAHGNNWNRYWASDDGTRYTPIQNRWDDDRSHVQFYQRVTQNVNKMEALQNAANTFVDSVAALNDDITDSNQQHRISLVKFASDESNTIGNGSNWQGYNNSQVVSDLTAYTSATSSTLKNTINNLHGEGATRADYGLHQAQRVLTGEGDTAGARSNAKKIVIFFTDGNPTSGSSWEGDVAARAINYAYDIKATGAQIYSIGVFQDANPSDTTGNFNRYMNAVSSNYKDAECVENTAWPWEEPVYEQTNNFGDLNLGNRTPGAEGEPSPDYYFAASDAEQLNQVFDDITSSITEGLGSGSPIEETTFEGEPNPGTLTFEDQLGDYMQVTGTGVRADKIQLAYGDQIYTSESKTTEGNVDTYHFANQTVGGNEVYGEANLADIVVTVERSNDLSVGDKITVTLPASLLPMRHYDVDTDNGTMKVTDAYPVRLFYGVTLKTDAKTALDTASGDTYQGILNNVEVSEDGTLDFYSNAFTQNDASGLTTASFKPSEGNKFYYYTEDTPLYVDEACQTRATSSNIVRYDTVYYADTYWKTENGTTSETTTDVAVSRDGSDFSKIQYDQQDQAYIPAHTQRGDRPSTLVSNKEDFEGGNVTGTASSVLVPSWNGDGTVSQALGNNGKFSYPAPGDLEIKKEVDWGNASDATKTSKNTFTFQVSLDDSTGAALTGTYNYAVYGAGADPDRTGTISNNGTVSITPDERVLITGLPAGATYTVTEQGANSNGFTTADSSTGENANTTDGKVEGAIVGGVQQSVTFKNTYHAAPVNLSTKATLQVQKNLTGRDWRATDEFTFEIDGLANTATGETAPEPAQTTVTVTDETLDYTAAFGDITFTKPGEYRYAITEHNDINPIDGIDYSAARYRAIVTVTDNGTGNLVVDSVTIEQRQNDDGVAPVQQPTITNNTVVFTNNYDVENGTTNIDGTKNYADTTGGNPIDADKFTFQLKAVGGFDTATGSADDYAIDAADVPMPAGADENHAVTTTNTGYGFGFPTISYDGNDVGKTFVYEVTELAGTESGMSYDTTTTHTVQVLVSEVEDPEHPGQMIIVATPNMAPEEVVFNNTYDPTDATLEGEDAIHGTKTLTGRDMLEDETFYFQLTQTGGPATVDPDDGDAYVTVLQDPEAATVAADDGDMEFNFNDLTFPQTGEYTFTVNEVAADGTETADGSGLTYDKNICTVTVNVTDNKQGALVADVTYANQGHDETDQAVFTNTYEASVDYGANGAGGIKVTKQILDRTMAEGDYTFTITGEGEAADLVTDADASFTNTAAAVDGTVTMEKLQSLKFDQDDAGKTFTFTVDEADPAEGQAIAGVAYDKSQYKVEIEVVDNGNGTMHTVTTVTKTMDAAGEPMNEVVVDHTNSDADGYTVPTFGFVNDYNPGSVTIGEDAGNPIQVTKTVAGAPSPADVNYSFTLKLTSDNKAGISEGLTQEGDAWVSHVSTSGVINQDATDGTPDDSQTVTFGNITFTEPGTYTFEVAEDAPAADDGWTFDTAAKTVTVVVSDLNQDNQYDGDLHIASVTGSPVKVTNRYEAGPVVVGGEGAQQQVTVKKSVTGANSTSDFTFDIAAVDEDDPKWNNVEAVETPYNTQTTITGGVTQAQSKTATFGAIKFNAEGTYQFTVTESGAAEFNAGTDRKGWTYDEHSVTVTVTVDDTDYDGQLEAEVTYDNSNATTEADKAEQNAAAFTNKYNATEITTGDDAQTGIQVTKKVTGHDAIEAFEFSLELAQGQDGSHVFEGSGDGKTAFDGMTLTTSEDIKAGATETKTFGDITFTAAGDYTFVIDETTEKADEGWTYDTDTAEVTVHVKDNGEGALYIESIEGNNPEFENVYQLQPAKFRAARFQLQGNKVLDGRNWETGDEFTFTLTAGRGDNVDGSQMSEDEVAATMPDSTSDTIRPADGDGSKVTDNSAQFTFTDERFPGEVIVGNEDDVFTYTKPGTYRYLIRETNPNVSNPGSGILGVSYDQTVYRLTVKVTDNGDGTMNAEGSYTRRNADGTWADLTGSNEVTFTNKYSSDEIDVTFNAFKVLEDRDQNMEDGEFTFHMEFAGWAANGANADPSDDSAWTMDDTTKAPEAAEDTGNIIRGDVTFGEMAFTKDNVGYTYRYKITENAGTVPGVTYDKSVHYVTAKVTSVSTPDDPQDPDGAYTEHVRVETSGEAEWNEQNGTAPTSGAIFTNTYEAGAATGVPADFQLTKQFTGHEWTDDYVFEFTLAAQDSELADGTPVDVADVPMPVNATKTVNAPDEKDGDTATFDFGSISYDKAGTYRYTVTETHAGETLDGITYDAQPAQVTVTVTEGKDPTGALTGQLVATATVTNGDFVNTYETSAVYNATGVGGLDITKQVTNHAMTDGQFSFTITAAGDNADAAAEKLGIEDGTTTTVESAQAEAGVATSVKDNPFETVTFDKSDDGVTYTYTITENGKTGEGDYKNYVLDDSTYTVQIKPVDNGDGTMTVTTQVSDGAGYTEMTTDQRATVPFVNSYQADPTTVGAEGAATIEGTKTLKNDILADGQFTFQVKNGDVVVATGTNAANGTITFDDITYTTENLAAAATPEGSPEVGKTAGAPQVTDKGTVYTFNYTVSEVEPAADSGVTASTAAQNITVTVTDDGNGTLTPVVTYGDGDPLAFENVYGGDAEFPLDIAGTKQIVGAQDGLNVPVLKADDYEFTIVGNPAQDGTPAPMPAVTTVANDASGNVTFEDIVYTMENTFGHASATGVATLTAGRTQVFTYTISESGSVDGVTNEQGTKTVEVTVTDLGGGKLEAEVTSVKTDEGADFAFTNMYDVNPTTSSLTGKSGFEITKKLTSDTGRKLAKDEFSFQLTSGDTVVATASNDADGTVSFDGIEFTKPGTYDYVLSEVNDGKPGVDYDATSYNVTATATDNGDGTLTVTWDMPQAVDDAVTFTNVYDPADATVTLGAGKTFAGADLKDGQFTFQLTGADESTPMPEDAKDGVSTATNDENGSVVFDTIAYGKPGTYKYTVSEVNDEQDGVTYDDTTYEVTVTVTDDTATGTLKAAVSYGDADAMVFSNQYKKPVEPAKPTIPKTGIDVIIPGVAGLVLLLGAGGVYAFKRRKCS